METEWYDSQRVRSFGHGDPARGPGRTTTASIMSYVSSTPRCDRDGNTTLGPHAEHFVGVARLPPWRAVAAISISDESAWTVARWAFRALMERAVRIDHTAEDREIFEPAVALDGLYIDLLGDSVRPRLVGVLREAASNLRDELRSNPSSDPREGELAEALLGLDELLAR